MKHIQTFKPSIFFRNRHLQTIITPVIRKPTPLPPSKPWSIAKDQIVIQGQMNYSPNTHRHLVVIFHGLGGHIDSAYVTGAAASLLDKGLNVLRVSLRGGNDDSEHTYHANQIDDIDWIVDELHTQGFKISLMGFSLSASMILKWLEHERNIQHALLISPPLDLDHCVSQLDRLGNRIYQKYFLKKLRYLLERKNQKHPHLFEKFMKPETFSSIRGFDSYFTAQRNGFSSAEEYYKKSSPTQPERIQNNICIIHSKDDPFIGHKELVALQKLSKPNIQVNLTNYGGHVGFYHGPSRGYMIDQWAAEYFESALLKP